VGGWLQMQEFANSAREVRNPVLTIPQKNADARRLRTRIYHAHYFKMTDKPRDTTLYWETLEADGEPYFFNELAEEQTTYDSPIEKPTSKNILLPLGWAVFKSDDGEPYFFNEGTGETNWDIPDGAKFGAKSPLFVPAGAPKKLVKVDDTKVYWQTLQTDDKELYYFQEDDGVTQYDPPVAQVKTKKGLVWPILLPLGWIASATEDGEVYFADEGDTTTWELPKGCTSCEPIKGADGKATAVVVKGPRVYTKEEVAAVVVKLEENIKAWKARKAAGEKPAFRHRTLLFRKKEDDTFMTVNPLERDLVRSMLADRAYEKVGYLSMEESIEHGFNEDEEHRAGGSEEGAPRTLWTATLDEASGRSFYFNIETKATTWLLPPGGKVITRVVPKAAGLVARVTGMMAAIALIKARKAAQAQQGLTGKKPAKMEGFLFKNLVGGRPESFKWRWLLADGERGELQWFHSDPERKGGETEPCVGRLALTGAKVELVKAGEGGAPAKLPSSHALRVTAASKSGPEKTLILCARGEDLLEEWQSYLTAVAGGKEIKAGKEGRAKATDFKEEEDKHDGLPPAPGFLIRQEGTMGASSAEDGTALKKTILVLDPDSRLLLLFDDNERLAGSERAVVDMLSANVTTEPPEGSPPIPEDFAPFAMWISVDSYGVYGPPKGKNDQAWASTAVITSSVAERDVWLACLAAACDPTTVVQLQDESKAAAATSNPLVVPTMLHQQLKAGFFSSLGSALERKIVLDTAETTLTIYNNSVGSKVVVILKLTAPGVRIDFACDDKPVAAGWSRLRLEITAPQAKDSRANPQLQSHVLRPRSYQEYTAWASALASL